MKQIFPSIQCLLSPIQLGSEVLKEGIRKGAGGGLGLGLGLGLLLNRDLPLI